MTKKELQLPLDIDELRAILRSFGVIKASVYGSYARGDATPQSDLDLLVELEKDRSYFDLGGLQYQLAQLIPGGVDLTTKLNHRFEPYIRDELVEIL